MNHFDVGKRRMVASDGMMITGAVAELAVMLLPILCRCDPD